MIYNHALNRGGKSVQSPLDELCRKQPDVLSRNNILPPPKPRQHPTALSAEDYGDSCIGVFFRSRVQKGVIQKNHILVVRRICGPRHAASARRVARRHRQRTRAFGALIVALCTAANMGCKSTRR